MTPKSLPTPGELTLLSDREILLLTVQGLHDLRSDFTDLTDLLVERVPSRREKMAAKWGGGAGLASILAMLLEVGYKVVHG